MMPSLLGNLRTSCIAFVALWLGTSSVHAAPESGVNITAADVAALNSTVNGRLFQGTPVSLPCFSSFNGQPHAVDNGSCTAVQAGYTTPEFRAPMFGAYMQVCRGCFSGMGAIAYSYETRHSRNGRLARTRTSNACWMTLICKIHRPLRIRRAFKEAWRLSLYGFLPH